LEGKDFRQAFPIFRRDVDLFQDLLTDKIAHFQNPWTCQPIMTKCPDLVAVNQPSPFQDIQMLGDIGFGKSGERSQFSGSMPALAKVIEDFEPFGVGQRCEYFGDQGEPDRFQSTSSLFRVLADNEFHA
jgi:hypothetical protein